tara:strand:- start:2369 stop:3547 length:1179 start_codon:yes stop_codon:yes gene_type:complete
MSEITINNRSGMVLSSLMNSLNEFYPYSKKTLGFDQDASFNFISDPKNGEKLLGKTAYYDPSEFSVTIYVDNRHPKDILRSISHELVHHTQNCRGDLSNLSMAGEQGYAQKDSHLREMEREAYEKGNMIFRDWEDGVKSKNNNADTIYERVVKNWGYQMFEDSRYQKIVKSKHNAQKARINKTGANKTKAAPFDRGSSSKRAKSAPPGAGLEENGENKVMDTKVIEEVVKSVLKRLRLEAGKDLDGDGDVDSDDYLKAKDNAIKKDMKEEAAGSEEQEVSEDDGIEEGSGDRNDPDREQGHGEQRQRASSSASGGKLEEFGADCEEDEEDLVQESKKTLKSKFKKARRENDKKEMRRIKQHLSETKTLKEDLVRRKSNLNERLMNQWFNHKK